jgi:hypothetical protein
MNADAVVLLLASPLLFLLFSRVQQRSIRRLFRVTDDMIGIGLLAEAGRRENEIAEEAAREKLSLVHGCERRVYGRLSGKDARRPTEPAVTDPEDAAAAVAETATRLDTVDDRTRARRAEAARAIEDRRAAMVAVNRRLRVTDTALIAASTVGLVWLSAVVALTLFDLLV